MDKDIRWKQRLHNLEKAFFQLEKAVEEAGQRTLSELEKEGLIQRFEYTYELCWKTLQDLLKHRGYVDLMGPGPVLAQAAVDKYIDDGKAWKKMTKSRNLTSHTYNQETANRIVNDITKYYYSLIKTLVVKLKKEP
jgi:nucleotidyltransferase substrate binding protein (TIGR01987 family)